MQRNSKQIFIYQLSNQVMSLPEIKENQKVTIAELQRFFPFPPPSFSTDFPVKVQKYLASTAYNNLSYRQQNKKRSNFQIAYRCYFAPQKIVQYIQKITKSKFSSQSVRQALANTSQKHGLIDWYKFVRIIIKNQKKAMQKPQKNCAARLIQNKYKVYVQTQKNLGVLEQISTMKNSLQPTLLSQMIKEVVNEVKQHVQANMTSLKLSNLGQLLPKEMKYFEFENLINKRIQCVMDSKKIKYIFIQFETKSKGAISISQFLKYIMPEQKIIVVHKPGCYLVEQKEIVTFIKNYIMQYFKNGADLVAYYAKNYQKESSDSLQLTAEDFYQFLKDKCENKLSFLQTQKLRKKIMFVNHLNCLYTLTDLNKVQRQSKKMEEKITKKKQLKKQNQVYYSFRTIILNLISKCKSNKLTRAQFSKFATSIDPSLKYDAFYAVWRVHPGIINIQRLKEQSKLPLLACYLKLMLTPQLYEKKIQEFHQSLSEQYQLVGSKIEEKVNLHFEFVLQTLQIKLFPNHQNDLIDYNTAIQQIFPDDFQIILRSYVFRKVSQKFILLWKSIRAKKRMQREKEEKQKAQLAAKEQKQRKQSPQVKNKGNRSKLSSSLSNANKLKLQKSESKDKKEKNAQSILIVKEILAEVFQFFTIKQKSIVIVEPVFKKQIVLACTQKYTFRSNLSRVHFHWLLGMITFGKEFLLLNSGQTQHLNIKLPFRPSIQAIDFVVWGNDLAILTSLSSIQLFSLTQASQYPYRTLYLSRNQISQQVFDQIVPNRIYRQFPTLLLTTQKKLWVNLFDSKKLVIIDLDPKVSWSSLQFTFEEHFFPDIVTKIIEIVRKRQLNKRKEFVLQILGLLVSFNAKQQKDRVIFFNSVSNILQGEENLSQFQCLQWLEWLLSLGNAAKCVLNWQLGLRTKRHIPLQLKRILQLLREYMLTQNLSLNEIVKLMKKAQKSDQGVTLKQFKQYLLKLAYQELIQHQKTIDKFLNQITMLKTIDYHELADIIGFEWPYSPFQRPLLVIYSFFPITHLDIIAYTIVGFSSIFIKQISTNLLVGILKKHTSTPILYFLPEQLILFSADSQCPRGTSSNLYVWRLYQDLLEKYKEKPPWKIQPFYQHLQCHNAVISSISFIKSCNALITTSLDGSYKLWSIQTCPFKISQFKRVYSDDSFYLSAKTYKTFVKNSNITLQKLVVTKISRQISSTNAYPYQISIEQSFSQEIRIKIPGQAATLPLPIRLTQVIGIEGTRNILKKKALITSCLKAQIQQLTRGTRLLESVDKNMYYAVKSAFVFAQNNQLKALVKFLQGKNEQGEIIVKVFSQKYGLNLVEDLQDDSLELPPLLQSMKPQMKEKNQQLYLPQDSVAQILKAFDQIKDVQQLIDQQTLKQIVNPHLFGQVQDQFNNLLAYLSQKRSDNLINLSDLKANIKAFQHQGIQEKFFAACRALHRCMKRSKVPLWELFTVNVKDLDRNRKIRVAQFTQKARKLGLQTQYINKIVESISRNGVITLFQVAHFIRVSTQQINPSILFPNYSGLIMSKSILINKQEQYLNQEINATSSLIDKKFSVQSQIKSMLQKHESKAISESESLLQSRKGSRSIRQDDLKSSQLMHSASQGSLSRQGKDKLKRQAESVMKKMRQLLQNQEKNLWEVVAIACSDFIKQSLISQAQYFSIFNYIRTPIRLSEKIKLLQYLRKESAEKIDINYLFQLLDFSKKLQGDKYLLLYLVSCLQTHYSSIFEHAIHLAFFKNNDEITSEDFLLKLAAQPFQFARFAISEWEALLADKRLARFGSQDLKKLVQSIIIKYHLNIQFNKISLVNELIFRVEKKGQLLASIFPPVQKVTFDYFRQCASKIQNNGKWEQDYRSLEYSIGKKLQSATWKILIQQLEKRMGKATSEAAKDAEAAKKLYKALQARKISPFQFFIAIDRNRKLFITQEQLQLGLIEMGVNYDFWPQISKKNMKRLFYYEFLSFLFNCNVLPYKAADSALEIAMDRFIKRYLRGDDIESCFRRLSAGSAEVNFDSLKSALRNINFQQEETKLLHSLFSNDKIVRGRRWGNDQLLNDPANLGRVFNFKQFSEAIVSYRGQNLVKSPTFRFYDYLKKRSVSLTFEFKKWLDSNRKIKEVGQALKKQSYSLPKSIFIAFLSTLHRGFTEADFKQILIRYKQEVDFHIFVSYLEDTYKKAVSQAEKQEALQYLKLIVQRIQKLSVTIQRLFADFSNQKAKMGLNQLTNLSEWLGTGLTKIQLKKILLFIDTQKEGHFGLNLLAEAIQAVQATIEKQEQDFRFDYIIQKLANSKNKFVLKSSKLLFTLQRTQIIFEQVLNHEQCEFILMQACKQVGKAQISEKEMEEFIMKKISEVERRVDKKDKQTGLKMLNYFTKLGVEIDEAFSYISKHSRYEHISKQQFILILQSFQIKVDLTQIGSLFQFLEQGKGTFLQKNKWQQKLGMLKLSIQQHLTIANDDLKVFYKVKLFLTQLYLLFIKKSYKSLQIYHFFDRNSTGILSHDLLVATLIELGVKIDQDLAKKLTNYLDRNRDGTIAVNYLIQQLQNCIGSKMRLIINTKTSMLFKEKSKILSDQSTKFIAELARRQELDGDTNKSTIADYSFVSLLKQFGCILKQDQVQDIRRTFQAGESQLLLYPIYESFSNLFQQSTPLPNAERDRYRRLMQVLIQNNCTLKNLQKLANKNDLLNFLEQLGSFTLMQAKALIQSNLIQGSNSIDIQSLKSHLRDAYLTQEQSIINQSFVRFSSSTKEDLNMELAQALDWNSIKQNLKSYPDRLTLDEFYGLLWQSGVWITKGLAKKYFENYAEGQLLQVNKVFANISLQTQELSRTNNLNEFQNPITQNENQGLSILLLDKGSMRVAEHIVKSLNFKGASLDKELNKFYKQNYGFISYNNWILFLKEIGLNSQLQEQEVKAFMQQYWVRVHNYKFDKEVLLQAWKIQHLLQEVNEICRMQRQQKRNFLQIKSKELKKWMNQMVDIANQLDQWLNQNGFTNFSINHLYRYFSEKYQSRQQLLPYFIKSIPQQINSYSQFLQWLQLQKDCSFNEDLSQIQKNGATSSLQLQKTLDYFKYFLSKNPIKVHQNAITRFTKGFSFQFNFNTQRIATSLYLKYVLSHKSLIEFTPVLISPESRHIETQLKVSQLEFNYNLKPITNLIVDQEEPIDQNGLLLINKKYLAFPFDYKYEFQSLASITNLLQPTTYFIKTKNFYLWQANRQSLPKGSLNYSWKYIPLIGRKILQQLSKIHSAGFCLPQLKWSQINKKGEIQKPLYPCPIDRDGNIKIKVGFSSIDFQSSYCCPQLFRSHKNQITTKCDSWIFGCILYEFIYGHPPSSFAQQIKQYLASTGVGFSLAEVLQMQELPIQFNYVFFNQKQLHKLFSMEHELCPKRQLPLLQQILRREQSFSGLTYNLQILYQDQLVYYKDQFRIIKQLNTVIWQCLNLSPSNRPSIQQILQNPLFQVQQNLQEYLQTLAAHQNTIKFYQQGLEHLFNQLSNQDEAQIFKALNVCLTKLEQNKGQLKPKGKMNPKYVIPKQYPWPLKSFGPFSEQILAHKQVIRTASNFSSITLLFQSNFFDIAILTAYSSETCNSLLQKLLNIILQLMPQLKEYDSPLCAFIPHILDYLLRILYSQPWGFINKRWQTNLWLNTEEISVISQRLKQMKKNSYLKGHNFQGQIQRKCKSFLQQLILITGEGNAEYLPVNDYLREYAEVKQLLENVFSQIDLNKESPILPLNYFIDRLSDSFKASQQNFLKVEVDVMKQLYGKQQEKELCLTFFKEYLSLQIEHKIFKQLAIYAFLLQFLRNELQALSVKQISLEIISSLLEDTKYQRKLMTSSTNLLQQICRLTIQPPKNSAAHQEYITLKPFLLPIVLKIKNNEVIYEELKIQNEFIEVVIQNFLDKQDTILPLQSMNNLQKA